MARYDYRCPACGKQFEVEHPMAEHPTVTCPDCSSVAQQVFGASSIVFKGSGFYNTDMRGKGTTSATSATSGSTSSESGSSSSSKDSSSDSNSSSNTSTSTSGSDSNNS